jgi:protein-S-isoprenylcysteine O-methyltransferase Ste14
VTVRKPLPPTYLLIALVLTAVLHLLWPVATIAPFPWNLLGGIPLGGGLAVTLAADQAFKNHKTTVKPLEKPSWLVTGGVFRISRNPMYLGFTLLLVGVALLFGSLTPFVVVVVFAVLMDVQFIQAEERLLQATFGEKWDQYKKKVRRWL